MQAAWAATPSGLFLFCRRPMDRPLDQLLNDLELPGHRAVAEHWMRLYRSRGAIPTLAEIDPLDFHRALPDAWIVDATEDGRFRFRLMGETLIAWYGRNTRGLYYEDLFPPAVVDLVTVQSNRVLNRPCAGFQRVHTHVPDVHQPRYFERLTLPVRDKENGRVRHILGNSIFNRDRDGQPLPEADFWYPVPQ